MSKISTKNIPSGGMSTPKVLQPGNRVVKILSVELEKPRFKKKNPEDPDPYYVNLNVEGPDLGVDFQGFLIDKNDPSQGKYKGQIGKVKGSYYAFSNAIIGEVEISRDAEMLKFLRNLCKEMNLLTWLDSQDEKHDTIESMFEKFNLDKPFLNKWVRLCVAGQDYVNKGGYTNYNLFLPKYTAKTTVIELESVPEDQSRMIKFNEKEHSLTKKTETVTSFGEEKPPVIVKKLSTDFDL